MPGIDSRTTNKTRAAAACKAVTAAVLAEARATSVHPADRLSDFAYSPAAPVEVPCMSDVCPCDAAVTVEAVACENDVHDFR